MSYEIGRADIRQLELTTNEKETIDISRIIHLVTYFEDIYSPHTTCNIQVIDGVSLRSALPLSGGEIISMDIGDNDDKSRKLKDKFILYKMSNLERSGPDYEYYTLNFVTSAFLRDYGKIVNTAFTQKPIHEIVKTIVDTYFTPLTNKKLITVEETDGMQNLIATGLSPTTLIQQCVREAQSIENPASTYVFFETIEGYHFVTLDKLYKKDVTEKFIYDEIANSRADPNAAVQLSNNIRYLNMNRDFDLLTNQMRGGYKSINQAFDPLTKTFTSITHDAKPTTINKAIYDKYFEDPTTKRYIVTNSHAADVEYVKTNDPNLSQTFRRRDKFMGAERAGLHQFASIQLTASIPGNPNVKIGDTVQIVIPRASDTEEDKRLNDTLLTGKYLVSAISQKISAPANEFVTIMELLRPSYETSIK